VTGDGRPPGGSTSAFDAVRLGMIREVLAEHGFELRADS
jgi:hypothetical protein